MEIGADKENKSSPDTMSLIDDALKTELTVLYTAPDRHYHGLAHIEALLALARQHVSHLSDPAAVEAAIWFHDAIYESTRGDNEERSAQFAVQKLAARVAPDRIERIRKMIEATHTHQVPDTGDEAANRDAALFLDMDLSILGAPDERFDAYEKAVRQEYAWVAEPSWRSGRAAVLKGFLLRPHIFHTDIFTQTCEAQARKNIERSLERLV